MRRLIAIPLLILCVASQGFSTQAMLIAVTSKKPIDYTQDANCVGAWYMNANGGNETDRSGSSATLTESGGTIPTSTTVPPGYSGTSRDFEAGDTEWLFQADGGSTDINGATQSMSVCMWIYRETTGTADVAGKWVFGSQQQYRLRSTSGSGLGFDVSGDGSTSSGNYTSTLIDTASTWYHIAGVYNHSSGILTAYVNGVPNGTPTAYSGGIFNGNDEFYLGRSGDTNYYDGLIDEVILFDRALSNAEVAGIYHNGIDGTRGLND